MKIPFASKTLDTLPEGTHYDTKCPGLVLNVTKTSRRFGIYIHDPNTQKPKRVALGPWPVFSIDMARDKARELIYAIKRGEQEKPKAKVTLGDLADNYEKALKATGAKDPAAHNRTIDAGCPEWRNRAADSITRAEVEQRHNEIATNPKRGPMAAGRFVKTFRTIYRHADMDCPAARVRIAVSSPRARVADKDEMAAIKAELEKQDPFWRDYFMLLILTGARKSNVAGMRFEDVKAGTWIIPGTESKTGEAIKLPLVPEAVAIIERRRELQGAGFVFPSSGRAGRIDHTWEKWDEIRRAAGAPDLTQHDLRRTLISRLAEAGVSPAVAAKAAGHKSVVTTLKIYTVVRQDQVLDALNKIG